MLRPRRRPVVFVPVLFAGALLCIVAGCSYDEESDASYALCRQTGAERQYPVFSIALHPLVLPNPALERMSRPAYCPPPPGNPKRRRTYAIVM